MSIDEAPPVNETRVAFAERRRTEVYDVLRQLDLDDWTPLSEVVYSVADRTSLAKALVVEALFDIAQEGGEYVYRMGNGRPAIRHEG